jgi:flagellar basal body-associated protein FliL
MLLAIPTEIIIVIIIFLLILFAVIAGVFYMAANKAQGNEPAGLAPGAKADTDQKQSSVNIENKENRPGA